MDTYLDLSPDSSTPHTPSPPSSSFDMHPQHPKIHPDSYDARPDVLWDDSHRGSYLSDLYDDRMKLDNPQPYHPSPSPQIFPPDWHENQPDQHYYRRASYPHVRNDGNDPVPQAPAFVYSEPGAFLGPYSNRSDAFYGEPVPIQDHMPLSADPSALHGHLDDPYMSSNSASPHSSIHEFDAESAHPSPVIVPTQAPFYRPNQHPATFINPHASLPVMHTDDAASKETQYLRRRCFNCHTTEPPSWRRSTLNPGKIVCNKCGLYERTHLRPRPHRFDELRAGSKARKAAKVAASPNASPKSKHDSIKKEPHEGSVSSVGSSGVSEWDSGSAYSGGSSGYNSPMTSTFSIPQGHATPTSTPLPVSRPSSRDGPIRLPTAPLTDIATRLTHQQQQPHAHAHQQQQHSKLPPSKASSAPYYIEGRSTTLGRPLPPAQRADAAGRLAGALGMPEVTGWQVIPPSDLEGSPKAARKPRKVAAA
ncbi:hypothetical protein JB92DRAFT_2879178 [Gautieria morchelliformis]|nr:hypothetical protein JB92DRAFT_2879178 [Gautieria morchelliformis]